MVESNNVACVVDSQLAAPAHFLHTTHVACFRLRVPEDRLIPLTRTDESKLSSLLRRPYLTQQPNWRNEVSHGEGNKPSGGVKSHE